MEANQQFNLRWNNHTNNILQVFLEHLSSELLVDVTLSCQGQILKAHRIILSACSPYFQELFKHHTAKHPMIILNGIQFEDLQMMIKFMYHGEIRVQETQLDGLLAAAETLQVKGLSNVRHKYEKGEIHSQRTDKSLIMSGKHSTGGTTTKSTDNSENARRNNDTQQSVSQTDPPRIRKRRKMSHTVNELAKETVFTSNGAVCLKPETQINESESSVTNVEETSNNSHIVNFFEEEQLLCQTASEGKLLHGKGKTKVANRKAIIVSDRVHPPGNRIPRPPNAFMIFANEWRRKMAYDNPDCNNKEISVRLGVMWKGLDAEAKEAYYASARKADEDHKRKYPGYYYSPKEARLRKNLKQDLMLARCLPTNIRDADTLRLVKVIRNTDERQCNRVRAVSHADDKDTETDGALISSTSNEKKGLIDNEDNVSVSSVSP